VLLVVRPAHPKIRSNDGRLLLYSAMERIAITFPQPAALSRHWVIQKRSVAWSARGCVDALLKMRDE
jgi:hypothetical protein